MRDGAAGSISVGVTGIVIDLILPAATWRRGRLSLNRSEYQEYVFEGKGRRCVGLTTLHLSGNSGSLSLLQS